MRHQPAHMSRDTDVDDSRCAPPAERAPQPAGPPTPARLTDHTPYECSRFTLRALRRCGPPCAVEVDRLHNGIHALVVGCAASMAPRRAQSRERAFERGPVMRAAVRRENVLYRQVQQRAQLLDDLLARRRPEPRLVNLEPVGRSRQASHQRRPLAGSQSTARGRSAGGPGTPRRRRPAGRWWPRRDAGRRFPPRAATRGRGSPGRAVKNTGGLCVSTRARVSRSCHAFVSTTTSSRASVRARSSSGGAIGSKRSSRSPSSIAYDETARGHTLSSHSGCGACQCQRPAATSCTA